MSRFKQTNVKDNEKEKFEVAQDGKIVVRTVLAGAIPGNFDDVVLTYTNNNLTGVVYKLDTVTIRTLTLTYSGSNLIRLEVA